MRRLIVSALVSLDGVADAPDKLLAHWNEESRALAVEEQCIAENASRGDSAASSVAGAA